MKVVVIFVLIIAGISQCLTNNRDVCGLPHSRNGDGRISCEAYIPSWTFDAQDRECIKFIYGGCGGNDNRFPTKEKCEETCL